MRASDPPDVVARCAGAAGRRDCPVPTADAAAQRKDHHHAAGHAAVKKRPTRPRVQGPRTSLARARASARAREQARLAPAAAAGGDDAAVQDRRHGSLVPDVRAAAAIIFNPETGQVLWRGERAGQAVDRQHHQGDDRGGLPRRQPDLSRAVTIERSDVYAASTTYLRANERVTLERPAAPDADRVRQRRGPRARPVSHGGTAPFIERMNEKAIELGLQNTTFADPVGPQPEQRLVGLRPVAPDHLRVGDERIAPIMRTPTYTVTTSRRRSRSTTPISS